MTSFGTPSKGGKFYTGSKHSNLWVKDLLWARYCVKEGKSYGLKDIQPPMMAMYRGDAAMVDKSERLPQVRSPSRGGDGSRVAELEAQLQEKVSCGEASDCRRLACVSCFVCLLCASSLCVLCY